MLQAVRFLQTQAGRALVPVPREKLKQLPLLAAKQFYESKPSKPKRRSLKRREIKLKKQIIRDVNTLKQYNIRNVEFKVDPVLGAKDNDFVRRMYQEIDDSANLAHGYTRAELEKLLFGAQKATVDARLPGDLVPDSVFETEEKKKRAVLTILNMKNLSLPDRRKLAISFARKEFERFPGDTGSLEVQAAVMTAKIHFAFEHVKRMFKDKAAIQQVRQLVHQRQKVLKYLKQDDAKKYFHTIAKLGLTDDVVTREFPMDKQYFQDYKVWGDKQLVKPGQRELRKQEKLRELEKRVNGYNQMARENYERLQAEL